MFLGIQKNSRGAEGKNKKTPDPFFRRPLFRLLSPLVPSAQRNAEAGLDLSSALC